jgi:molecular chaperone GrpE (heat shock protein)
MNDFRRKRLDYLKDKLADICDEIEIIREEEENAFDNLPESLQDSERGEAIQDAVYQLEEISDNLQQIIEDITTLTTM